VNRKRSSPDLVDPYRRAAVTQAVTPARQDQQIGFRPDKRWAVGQSRPDLVQKTFPAHRPLRLDLDPLTNDLLAAGWIVADHANDGAFPRFHARGQEDPEEPEHAGGPQAMVERVEPPETGVGQDHLLKIVRTGFQPPSGNHPAQGHGEQDVLLIPGEQPGQRIPHGGDHLVEIVRGDLPMGAADPGDLQGQDSVSWKRVFQILDERAPVSLLPHKPSKQKEVHRNSFA